MVIHLKERVGDGVSECEKTSKLIQEMVDYHGCDMWPQRFKQMADESDEELNELVAKAAELDRREKGVMVIDADIHQYCGNCNEVVDRYTVNYCTHCGVRVDLKESGE